MPDWRDGGSAARSFAVGLAGLLLAAGGVAGCNGDDAESADSATTVARASPPELPPQPRPSKPARGTVVVYASLPLYGPTAPAGDAVALGMRHALDRAWGRAGPWRVRLVVLSSTSPGARGALEPATVRANARRAVGEGHVVAYVGELDRGWSAVSLPVTRQAGLLQVSPADGLTSLGRTLPSNQGRRQPRYYVDDSQSNFARLVPPDLDATREAADQLERLAPPRLAVIGGGDRSAHEFADMVLVDLPDADDGREPAVTRVTADHGDAASIATAVADARPDAVLYAGPEAPPAARAIVAALAHRLPDVPVIGGPPLAAARPFPLAPRRSCAWTGVPEPPALPPRGQSLLAELRQTSGRDELGVDALLGAASMDVVLDAIAAGGRDRRAIMNAARSGVDHDDVVTGHGLGGRAHVEGESVVCVALRGRGPS